jgi:hypothetical protein
MWLYTNSQHTSDVCFKLIYISVHRLDQIQDSSVLMSPMPILALLTSHSSHHPSSSPFHCRFLAITLYSQVHHMPPVIYTILLYQSMNHAHVYYYIVAICYTFAMTWVAFYVPNTAVHTYNSINLVVSTQASSLVFDMFLSRPIVSLPSSLYSLHWSCIQYNIITPTATQVQPTHGQHSGRIY